VVCGTVAASTGGLPAGVPGEATLGEGRPAALGVTADNPAGKREVKPAGLGKGEGKPVGLGVPRPATPGVMVAGAAGWGAARKERLAGAGVALIGAAVSGRAGVGVCPMAAVPASKAKAQTRRSARRGVGFAFTA